MSCVLGGGGDLVDSEDMKDLKVSNIVLQVCKSCIT